MVTIEGGTFSDNEALELGGAFVAWGAPTVVTVNGGLFSNNTAKSVPFLCRGSFGGKKSSGNV